MDTFAKEWTSTVERVNNILHGETHAGEEALDLLGRVVDLLAALLGPMSSRLEEADRLATVEAPNELQVRRALELLADERLRRYFFSKVDSPKWLEALDAHGVFSVPMQGDWYQGGFLVRVSPRAPQLGKDIAGRIVGDSHRASPVVVLGVVRELGTGATALAVAALKSPSFADPFLIAHELELVVEKWAPAGATETFHELADAALEPRCDERSWDVDGKFEAHQYNRLVTMFVSNVQCEHLIPLTDSLLFKLRRATRMTGASGVSFRRDLIDANDNSDRDVGNSLISGVRDALRRLRECGVDLATRMELLGDLDNEILVRLWAHHLSEEEQDAS